MTYQRFEELPVWETAIELALCADEFLESVHKKLSWSKRDQLDRASLSVSNNIAEGFERGTTPELLKFLYIARGSSGEVRSMVRLFQRVRRLSSFAPDLRKLADLSESCSRQIAAWTQHLQSSEIRGQRHLKKTLPSPDTQSEI